MFLRQLSLCNFRNYSQADVTLQPGLTVILGPNGQGKTNLIEPLVFLAQGVSHRVTTRDALIHKDRASAVVRATFVSGDRTLSSEILINRSAPDRAQINGNPARFSDVTELVSVVLFAPEDLMLIRGEPLARRQYIDSISAWLTPRLRATIADYDRTLKQRNSLLKSLSGHRLETADLSTLDVWDESLSSLGSEIHQGRLNALNALRPHVLTRYATIAGADHRPEIDLSSSVTTTTEELTTTTLSSENMPPEDSDAFVRVFRQRLLDQRRHDIERGQTTTGPHRDDVRFHLKDLPAKGYASHGETWSLVLALRLAELDLKRAQGTTGDPIVILDDVYAELDKDRRQRLEKSLSDVEQVLVTSAVDDDVPGLPEGRRLRVENGHVWQEAGDIGTTASQGNHDVAP